MAKKTNVTPSVEYLAAGVGYIAGLVTGVLIMAALFATEASAKDGQTIVLSDSNTVNLRLPITDETVIPVQKEIIKRAQKGTKDIYLVLNSPGGSIQSGKMLIETAKGSGARVHTISIFSASMSFIISQALDTRYALASSTLMSHRAFSAGLAGHLPGSLLSQLNGMLFDIWEIESMVAARAKYSPEDYAELIRDELWITGSVAKNMRFIDEVVTLRCDKSLNGDADPVSINVEIFNLSVVFPKCPLLEQPTSVSANGLNSKKSVNLYNKFLEETIPVNVLSRWKAHTNASHK